MRCHGKTMRAKVKQTRSFKKAIDKRKKRKQTEESKTTTTKSKRKAQTTIFFHYSTKHYLTGVNKVGSHFPMRETQKGYRSCSPIKWCFVIHTFQIYTSSIGHQSAFRKECAFERRNALEKIAIVYDREIDTAGKKVRTSSTSCMSCESPARSSAMPSRR